MPGVSVVVPIYKAEDSIKRCIESILCQTYSDFELILVDDGSPDKSGTICDEYAVKDNRIKVIHKSNDGVSSARNTGIDVASGKYICFVDSDDFVESNYLEELYVNMEKGYSFVICGYRIFKNIIDQNSPNLFCDDEYVEVDKSSLHKLFEKVFMSQPWNKMFRKQIIDDYLIRMPLEYSLGEDTLFVLKYLNCIVNENFLFINKPLYNYFVDNSESLLNKYRNNLLQEITKLNNEVISYIKRFDLSPEQIQFFYNTCFYRVENVLRNTFHKNNSQTFLQKLVVNYEILKSEEFAKWYTRFNGKLNWVYKFCYRVGFYLPIYLMENR